VAATADLESALDGARLVVSAVPSHVVRTVMGTAAARVDPEAIVVSASKGIEERTLKRMTEVLADVLGGVRRLAALSGPSFAAEVGRGAPTAVTLAAHDPVVAESAREAFFAPLPGIPRGRRRCGARRRSEEVFAIATGIAGYGHNARRVSAVSRRSGTGGFGGRRLTFMGHAGLGDLVLTCTGT
jgi:glycerol-3-phosphate dehydrogenase (NAD(P)+)